MSNSQLSRLPTYFISHGGGPWPWMKQEMGTTYDKLAAALADMPRQIGRTPRAILMISAHWEAPAFTVMGSPLPPMLYDYGGSRPIRIKSTTMPRVRRNWHNASSNSSLVQSCPPRSMPTAASTTAPSRRWL